MSKSFLKMAAAASISMLALGGIAQAAPLVPGSVLIPAAAEVDPSGGVLLATVVSPFAVPGKFSGTLTSAVYSGDATNALGGLTFTYWLTNDGVSGPNSIGRLSVEDFTGFLTDASYQVPVTGIAPGSIDRIPSGDVIGFHFLPTPIDPATGFLSPGTNSALLVVQTNAPAYTQTLASIIDGGVTTAGSLGPAVPEPGIGLGAAALGLMLARRRRA